MSFERFRDRVVNLKLPVVQNQVVTILLGLLNCLVFGLGMIIFGAVNDCWEDVVIGLLQMFVPVVGWIWAIVWGILIIYHSIYTRNDRASEQPLV